ncbi:MAG: TIR domain-containing protein [Saprospiraceae bacterium]|nr:TIR domain-containing protein [Saprospiraceae bacterium]
MSVTVPEVFISYSWDSPEHKEWVRRLADRLISRGVNVVIDAYDCLPGANFIHFMEQAPTQADRVLIILTQKYKAKADNREKGVGYEGTIISAEIYNDILSTKFIPLLRQGDSASSTPLFLKGKVSVDFRNEKEFETNFQELLNAISGFSVKPQIGTLPDSLVSSGRETDKWLQLNLPDENQDNDFGLNTPQNEQGRALSNSQHADKIYNIEKIDQAIFANGSSPISNLPSAIAKELPFPRPEAHIPRQVGKRIVVNSHNGQVGTESCDLIKELDSHSRIVLLGDSGIGKSWELKWICHELKDNSSYIPIFRSLKGKKRLTDLPHIEEGEEAQVVLILDGLDESRKMERMVESIEYFANWYPNAKVIVSCRNNAYLNTLDRFEQYELGPLRQDDIEQFVEKKLGLAPGREFLNAWYGRHPLNPTQLIENPFYLFHLCEYVKNRENALPKSFGQVFEYLVDRSLNVRLNYISQYGNGDRRSLRRACRKSLEKLAFVMECRAGNIISNKDLRNIIPSEKEIEILLGKSSLIELHDEHNWQFVHNNFQEYLAAVALSRASSLEEIKKAVAAKPDYARLRWTWTNTLSFLLEILEDSDPMKEALMEWIEQSDIEALVKIGSFEKDKISAATRDRIFKAVFEACKKDEIVIGFRHYSPQDLAEFGESAEAFRYLMNELHLAKAPIVRSNALVLLRRMKPYYLPPNIQENLRKELFRQIFEVPDNSGPGRYYAIESLLHLYPNDLAKERSVEITERFFDSPDAWERTAAYHVIERHKLQLEFVQNLVTRSKQLEDFAWRKGEMRIVDEDWRLEKCFEGIKDEETLILFLEQYIDLQDEERWYRKNKYLNILLKKLHEIKLSQEGVDRVCESMKAEFIEWIGRTSTIDRASINRFIESNKLQFRLFRFCVDDKMLSDFTALIGAALHLNYKGIEHLANRFQSGHIQRAEVEKFLQWVANNNEAYLLPLIERLSESAEEPFETPAVPPRKDHALIERKNVAAEKALLFNKEKFIATTEAIFAEFGKDSLEEQEVYGLYKNYPHDDEVHEKYPHSIMQFINAHHSKERSEVLDFINLHWDWISINKVKSYLEEYKQYIEENPEFGLDAKNLEMVRSWCDRHQTAIKPDSTFTNGDMLFFWFILYYKLDHYPAEVYFRMIDSPFQGYEHTEILPFLLESRMLSIQQIIDRLIEVLESPNLDNNTRGQYLKFIESKNIREALPVLPRFMENKEWGTILRYAAIKAYMKLGGDEQYLLELLKGIVPESDERELEELFLSHFSQKPNADFERFAVQKMEDNPDTSTQLIYAKTLFRIGNLAGLKYITEYMMREKKSPFHLSENFNLRFENPEGIPLLLRLFDIEADETVESDFYTRISAAGRSALVHLATCHDFKYFHQVREAIEQGGYIEHPDAQKEVKYMLKDIEFRYYQREEVTFEQALGKWKLLSK